MAGKVLSRVPHAVGLLACLGTFASALPAAAIEPHGKPILAKITTYNPDYQVFDFMAVPVDDRSFEASRPFVVAWDADNHAGELAQSGRKGRPDSTILRMYTFQGQNIKTVSTPVGLSTFAYFKPSGVRLSSLGKLDRGNVLMVSEAIYKPDGRAKAAILGQAYFASEIDTTPAYWMTDDVPASNAVTTFVVNLKSGGAYFAHFAVPVAGAEPASVRAKRLNRIFSALPDEETELALGFPATPVQMETLDTGFIALFIQQTEAGPRAHLQRYDDLAAKVRAAATFEGADATSFFRVLPFADGRVVLFEIRPADGGGSDIIYTPLSADLQPLALPTLLKTTDRRLADVKLVALKGGGFLIAESSPGRERTTNSVARYTNDFRRKGRPWAFEARDKVVLVDAGRGRAVVAYKTKTGGRLLIQGLAY
jgi:hypothetical protein